jgi:hypothetical protein
MSPARASLLVLAPLLLACGDSGESSGDGSTGMTGVTSATATATATATSTATAEDTGIDSASPTTTGPDPGTDTAPPDTSAGESTSTGFESLSDPGTGTTYASFSGTTGDDVCMQQIDIVFSMDVSTSMIGVLQKLENEILTVDEKLKSLTVVPDVRYGLVVFVDDFKIINGGAPYADVQTLKADFNYWWNFTQTNQEVNGGGSNGDWPENSIDALYTAAVAFQWRPIGDAQRIVIHCTDDTFAEKGQSLSGIPVQRTYDETVLALQNAQVRVFVFADNDATGGPGNNEDVSAGFFTPWQGKPPIPEATDGGAFNINLVNAGQLSLGAAINESVEQSLCQDYIPQ